MDLSVISPGVPRTEPSDRRPAGSDFADELKKGASKQDARMADAEGSEAEASKGGALATPREDGPSARQMLCQGHGSASMAPKVSASPEMGVMTEDRIISARVFGLHLLGAAYLSEYAHLPEAPGTRSEHAAGSGDTVASPRVSADGIETGATEAIANSAAGEADRPAPAYTPAGPCIEGDSGDSIESLQQVSSTAAWSAVYWPDRSLKVVPRSDGKNIAWLRDYALSNDQAREMAAEIVERLKAQGTSLHQIIWNGHEIWSSDESSKGN